MGGTIPSLPQYIFMLQYFVKHRDNSILVFCFAASLNVGGLTMCNLFQFPHFSVLPVHALKKTPVTLTQLLQVE
jgi:hypothetical protein